MESHHIHITLLQHNSPHISSLTTSLTIINPSIQDDDQPLHRRFPEAIFVGFPIAAALTLLTLLYKQTGDKETGAGSPTTTLNIFSSSIVILFCFASAAMTFRCKYPKIAAFCGSITILIAFFAFACLGCMILPVGWWWMAWLFSTFPLLPFVLGPFEMLLGKLVGGKVSKGVVFAQSDVTQMGFDLQVFDRNSRVRSMPRWPLKQLGVPQMGFGLQVLEDCGNPQYRVPQMEFDWQVFEGRRRVFGWLGRSILQPIWNRSDVKRKLDLQALGV